MIERLTAKDLPAPGSLEMTMQQPTEAILKQAAQYAIRRKCGEPCPGGGGECCLDAFVPHEWHICRNVACYCHKRERYAREARRAD